jgi:hypothetical protein
LGKLNQKLLAFVITLELKDIHHYLFIENQDEVVREMQNSEQEF